MSHTYKDESGVIFHFDGNLDGGVLEIVDGPSRVTIPAQAVLRLVAYHHVLPARIAELESLGTRAILGLSTEK